MFTLVFLLSSVELIEAMACGCCFVGSRGMPVSEVIEDGIEGVLIPMNSPGALAEKVVRLLDNPEERNRFGKAARKRALLYDQRLMLNQLLKLLQA